MNIKWIITTSLITILLVIVTGCLEDTSIKQKEDQNMALIKHIHTEMAKGNIEVYDSVLTSDYVRHCQAMPPELQEMQGSTELKLFIKDFIGAVSNFNETFDLMIASGDTVAYITTMTATQTGPMGELPATGKEFVCTNFIVHRFDEGKIAETWVTWDNLALLRQLGFFPPSTGVDNNGK